ncbi:hypothetical protein LWI29_010346 [Acer saccharum]|uniref:Polyprotein n=1 Tax=Acer saccharum TaxID=4024 RepID=A0AA39SKF4_ACESA|nr:hypothetical protein LWI29_010346 [Acer saccharum]
MARIMQLKQQLQSQKKGSDSIGEFVLKLKAISDALATGEIVSDRDIIISLLSGVGHEYDSVVTLISSQQNTMSLEDAQFLFLMHEQRIEQLNMSAYLSVTNPSAQYVMNNSSFNNKGNGRNNTSGNYRGNNRGRNRGGRFGGRSNQRLHCQLCSKPGHGAWQCYRRFDQQFQGGLNQGNQGGNSNQGSQAFVSQQQAYNTYEQGSSSKSFNAQNTCQENVQMILANAYQNTAYFATPKTVADQAWYVDSGATNHVTSNLSNLSIKSDYRGPENQENPTPRIS